MLDRILQAGSFRRPYRTHFSLAEKPGNKLPGYFQKFLRDLSETE
jgi:hypothetical protein